MADKTYKAIFVPADLHNRIKMSALKRKFSMIEYLTALEYDINETTKSDLLQSKSRKK